MSITTLKMQTLHLALSSSCTTVELSSLQLTVCCTYSAWIPSILGDSLPLSICLSFPIWLHCEKPCCFQVYYKYCVLFLVFCLPVRLCVLESFSWAVMECSTGSYGMFHNKPDVIPVVSIFISTCTLRLVFWALKICEFCD